MARFRSKSSSRQQNNQKVDPIRASRPAGSASTTTAAMASTKGFHMWGRRGKEIRPPSSASSAASEDGCRCKEFMASQHIQQDMVSIKTYLHRLRRILQDAETATLNSQNVSSEEKMSQRRQKTRSNFLDMPTNIRNTQLQSLSDELQFSRQTSSSLDEMTDLRRQLVLLQQQGEDKDRTIRQLQRQLEAANADRNRRQSSNNGVDSSSLQSQAVNGHAASSNVATQTDRVRLKGRVTERTF